MLNSRIFTFIINHKGNDYITHDVNLDVIPKDFIMSEFLNILARYKLDFDVTENNDKCFQINIKETINQDVINDLNEVFNQQTGELTMEMSKDETTIRLLDVFALTSSNRQVVNITNEKVSELLKELEPYYSKYNITLNNKYLEEVKDSIAETSIIEVFVTDDDNHNEDVLNRAVTEIKTVLDNIIYVNDMNCNGLNIKRGVRLIPKPVETKWELNKSYNYTDMTPKGLYVDSTTRIQLPLIKRVLETYTTYYIS